MRVNKNNLWGLWRCGLWSPWPVITSAIKRYTLCPIGFHKAGSCRGMSRTPQDGMTTESYACRHCEELITVFSNQND